MPISRSARGSGHTLRYSPVQLARLWITGGLIICALTTVLSSSCTVPFRGFSDAPVEGTVLDKETRQPLAEGTILIRALCCGGDELGRQQGSVVQGTFSVPIPIPAENPAASQYEITISRDGCETLFAFDTEKDVSFVDLPFPGGFLFRIKDPILVPPCTPEGGSTP